MFKAIKEFFLGKPKEESKEVPYKVEVPVADEVKSVEVNAPAKCGCGRSPTGYCVGLHKLTADEWSVHADNPNKVQPVVEAKVDPVSVALDLEPVDMATAPAEPAKKPRKPRAPKATAEKAPKAKKAAKPAAKPKAEKAPRKPRAKKQ